MQSRAGWDLPPDMPATCRRSVAAETERFEPKSGTPEPSKRGPNKRMGFYVLGQGPGGSGGPGSSPKVLRGPSRGLRRPPGSPRDLPQAKATNLET